MSEQDEFYEQAFDELENDNRVKSIWAKAYAMSSDEESAKRLYIKFRVEQLEDKTSAKESQSEPKSNISKQSVDKNKTSHTHNTTELHKDKIPFSQASTVYKSIFYGSVLVAIGLFFVGLEISNQVPAFLWAMVAFYTYKRNLTGAVTLQKAQIAFASAGGLAGIYLLSDSTPDIFLNLTSEQFLVPSIISIGVHLWLLRFFEKEKGESVNRLAQVKNENKDSKLPSQMSIGIRLWANQVSTKVKLENVIGFTGVLILIVLLTVTNEPSKQSSNSDSEVSMSPKVDAGIDERYNIIYFNGDRDALTGNGRIEWSDGEIEEGDFLNGQLNGIGIRKQLNSTIYHGEFKDAAFMRGMVRAMDGRALLYADIELGLASYSIDSEFTELTMTGYYGQLKEDGKYSGLGVAMDSEGAYYKGQFLDGQLNGPGSINLRPSDPLWKRYGIFEDGKLIKDLTNTKSSELSDVIAVTEEADKIFAKVFQMEIDVCASLPFCQDLKRGIDIVSAVSTK